jgi:prepilin-type N-terminal cleavage/methylation domain-containing protein
MKTKTKSRKGFTLIELMVAIVASAVVVLATGIVIVIGQTSWNQTWKKVNLQRDASYAMLIMSQSIKAATSAETEDNNTILTLERGEDPNIIFYYATDNLQYQIVGGQSQTIINGKVENLQFDVAGNTVTIDLSLKEDDVQTHFISAVMMRNYGG